MLNVGGAEFLVILLVALVVLGPTKLPEVARQVGTMARELRRISTSFQNELKSALDDPIEEAARERGNKLAATDKPKPSEDSAHSSEGETEEAASEPEAEPEPEPEPEPEISSAEAAGMYDVAQDDDVTDSEGPDNETDEPG